MSYVDTTGIGVCSLRWIRHLRNRWAVNIFKRRLGYCNDGRRYAANPPVAGLGRFRSGNLCSPNCQCGSEIQHYKGATPVELRLLGNQVVFEIPFCLASDAVKTIFVPVDEVLRGMAHDKHATLENVESFLDQAQADGDPQHVAKLVQCLACTACVETFATNAAVDTLKRLSLCLKISRHKVAFQFQPTHVHNFQTGSGYGDDNKIPLGQLTDQAGYDADERETQIAQAGPVEDSDMELSSSFDDSDEADEGGKQIAPQIPPVESESSDEGELSRSEESDDDEDDEKRNTHMSVAREDGRVEDVGRNYDGKEDVGEQQQVAHREDVQCRQGVEDAVKCEEEKRGKEEKEKEKEQVGFRGKGNVQCRAETQEKEEQGKEQEERECHGDVHHEVRIKQEPQCDEKVEGRRNRDQHVAVVGKRQKRTVNLSTDMSESFEVIRRQAQKQVTLVFKGAISAFNRVFGTPREEPEHEPVDDNDDVEHLSAKFKRKRETKESSSESDETDFEDYMVAKYKKRKRRRLARKRKHEATSA